MPKIPIFEKKNVLVTGGAGFLGSHVCERLLKEAKVICMDNLISGSLVNIDHLLQEKDFIFIKNDINEPIDFEKWPELGRFKVKFQGIQEVYNFACPTSPKDFEKYKLDTLKANSVGMVNVMDLAAKWKARVMIASSSVVYGEYDGSESHVSEEYEGKSNHLSPRACYDEGKRFAETIASTYQEIYGIDARIARIFRTYGPRVRLGSGEMIPDFVINALEGKPLVIYGDGQFTTSLCYINDLVDGIMKLMSVDKNPGAMNLGSDQEHNLTEVAQKIIDMTGGKSVIDFKDPLLFMRPQPLPNITHAKESLGWFPVTMLEDGLKQMIDYSQAHKKLLGNK